MTKETAKLFSIPVMYFNILFVLLKGFITYVFLSNERARKQGRMETSETAILVAVPDKTSTGRVGSIGAVGGQSVQDSGCLGPLS